MKKITIQDVAKELKLSRNTVAKALNNSDQVAYETRYVVIEKAFEMGYTKLSPVVLSEFRLKNRADEPKTVVCLARRELSAFWNRIIMGISDELNKHNCKLQLNFVSDEDERSNSLPIDLQGNVSGMLILSVFSKAYTELIEKRGIATVYLDMPCDREATGKGDIVYSESRICVCRIVSNLITQGIKDIGFIGDITYCKTVRDGYLGYMDALTNAGLTVDAGVTATAHKRNKYYNKEEVEDAVENFTHMPEAICCANDDIAMDVIRYLRKKNVKVPQTVAVTGYDNVEELYQLDPFLTTVAIDSQRLGRRLVQQLLWRIANPDFPQEMITMGVEIIFRASSCRL